MPRAGAAERTAAHPARMLARTRDHAVPFSRELCRAPTPSRGAPRVGLPRRRRGGVRAPSPTSPAAPRTMAVDGHRGDVTRLKGVEASPSSGARALGGAAQDGRSRPRLCPRPPTPRAIWGALVVTGAISAERHRARDRARDGGWTARRATAKVDGRWASLRSPGVWSAISRRASRLPTPQSRGRSRPRRRAYGLREGHAEPAHREYGAWTGPSFSSSARWPLAPGTRGPPPSGSTYDVSGYLTIPGSTSARSSRSGCHELAPTLVPVIISAPADVARPEGGIGRPARPPPTRGRSVHGAPPAVLIGRAI